MAGAATRDERNGLEKFLGIVTEVKAGEGATALLMTFNILLLLTAYYVIKPVREGLILAIEGGPKYKAYLGAAIAIVLLFAVPAYGAIAAKAKKHKLVIGVTLFFVSNLVVWRLLSSIESAKSWLGFAFFVWVGVFNVMVVAQFWAFGADIYNEDQGKRLFPLIGVGASSGAVIGSFVTDQLVLILGKFQMLLVSGAILCVCAFLTWVVHLRVVEEKQKLRARESSVVHKRLKNTMAASGDDMKAELEKLRNQEPKAKKKPAPSGGSFSMVFRYRYLWMLALFSLLFTTVNTNGEYILGAIISSSAKEQVASGAVDADVGDLISKMFANFFLYVNIVTFVMQTFVVSRVVKFGGLKWAFLVFPFIALFDAVALTVAPVLLTLRIFKTSENAADYSFNNTARNMLWLPTTRAMKYQAKQAVDTFFVRMGDVASGIGFVFVFAEVLGLGVRSFAITNIILASLTVVLCLAILREQGNLTKMKERGELPEDEEEEA